MIEALLIAHIIIMSTFLFFIHDSIKKLNKSFSTYLGNSKSPKTTDEHLSDEAELSSYEKERIAREKMFDERIKAMKDELSQPRHGVTAEVLHPNVYNLPHDEVKTRYDLIEEVAE